jgi:integrase
MHGRCPQNQGKTSVWLPALAKAGIEWTTWHDLRHTFASRLAMNGQNEGTIAALLRHSTTALVTNGMPT